MLKKSFGVDLYWFRLFANWYMGTQAATKWPFMPYNNYEVCKWHWLPIWIHKRRLVVFPTLYIPHPQFYSVLLSIIIVYDLKSVGPLEFKLVAPMPEQLKTTTMHFYEVSRKPYMCLLTPQRNALLCCWLVLGWVQRNSNFGSLDRRPSYNREKMTQ